MSKIPLKKYKDIEVYYKLISELGAILLKTHCIDVNDRYMMNPGFYDFMTTVPQYGEEQDRKRGLHDED